MSDVDGDLRVLDDAIARDAADKSLRVRRGALHMAGGRHAAALADFDVAIGLAPLDANAHHHRATAWLALAEVGGEDAEFLKIEAVADLDRCIALDQRRAGAFLSRGDALHDLDCAREAVADFRAALDLGTDVAHVGLRLAAAALDADLAEEARDAVDAVIASGREDAVVFHWKGAVLHALGDLPAAVAAFDEAIRRDPSLAQAFAYRARAWSERDDFGRAVDDLSRAIDLAPDEPSSYADRAEAWSMCGDERRADEDYGRSVLLQNPESMKDGEMVKRKLVYLLLRDHFGDLELDQLTVHERRFPRRVRADVQHALDALPASRFKILEFTGLASEYEHMPVTFARISKRSRHDPVMVNAPQREEVDVGTEVPVRCVVSGLWLIDADGVRLAMLLLAPTQHGPGGHHFQVAVPDGAAGLADELFGLLEKAVAEARCYRGKVLSLETCRTDYAGRATGIAVHRLPSITRDDVILPEATLELLERNVFEFVEQRARLRDLRMSTKKGLLFYGPPGTGKTHTIRYLASTLVGQTTLLITAEQIGLLDEYMILARLLQPAIVVIEDVDLIGRRRESQESPGTESLLNRLLNEMDGLRPDADVLFILTTNRPESLESALASRPGRIDQAIEFPRPDDACRRRLAELYAGGLELSAEALETVVRRTDGASASFVRELMRRSAQFMLSRKAERALEPGDVEAAAREMVEVGGSLNRALLGA